MKKIVKVLCSLVLALSMISVVTPVSATSRILDNVEIGLSNQTVLMGDKISTNVSYTVQEGYLISRLSLTYTSEYDEEIELIAYDDEIDGNQAVASYATNYYYDNANTYNLTRVFVYGVDGKGEYFNAYYAYENGQWNYCENYYLIESDAADFDSTIQLVYDLEDATLVRSFCIEGNNYYENGERIVADVGYDLNFDKADIYKVRLEYTNKAKTNYIYLDSNNDGSAETYSAIVKNDPNASTLLGDYSLSNIEFTIIRTIDGVGEEYLASYTLNDNGTWVYSDTYSGANFEVNYVEGNAFAVVAKSTSPISVTSLTTSLTSDPSYIVSGKSYTYTMKIKNVSSKNITYNLKDCVAFTGGNYVGDDGGYINFNVASQTSSAKTLAPSATATITFKVIVPLVDITHIEHTPYHIEVPFKFNNLNYRLNVDNKDGTFGASKAFATSIQWTDSAGRYRRKEIGTVKAPYYKYNIYKVGSMTMNKTSMTYTGSALKPTATVKDVKGRTIGTDAYRLIYTNNTKVGKATARLQYKGYSYSNGKMKYENYVPKIAKTFKINPKGTTLSTLTALSKGFKATWKKQATQTTGYQLRYSTSSTMSNAKTTALITSNTTLSKKVTKLTAKKKYYVQVRTYKTVNGTKYYSTWSAKKNVTTK